MPKIDLSFGVTAIIAICALLSPILTALLNNRHQIKIKRMDERRAALLFFTHPNLFPLKCVF